MSVRALAAARLLAVVVLWLALPASVAAGHPGALDSKFASGGVKYVDLGRYARGTDIFVDGAGTTTVAGFVSRTAPFKNVLLRFLPNGQADRSFGTNGRTSFAPPDGFDRTTDWARTPDGKFVGLGGAGESGRCYLVRYSADGRLDMTFAQNGVRKETFGDEELTARLLVLPSRQILVAGLAGGDTVIHAHTPTGTTDRSFGMDGSVRINGESFELAYQLGGRVLVVGARNDSRSISLVGEARSNLMVARFSLNQRPTIEDSVLPAVLRQAT